MTINTTIEPSIITDFQKAVACCELLQEHINDEIELSPNQLNVCAARIKKESMSNFFFFAKYVLGFTLLTEQTHKVWADNLIEAFYSHERIMRLKPRGSFKCLTKGTTILPYGIDDDYNLLPAKLVNQTDFVEEGIKVTLKSGRSFICTKDHPLKTIEGWGTPKEGMRVAVQRTIPSPYVCINSEEEFLLGVLLGDACLRGCTPQLSNPDIEIRKRIENAGYKIGAESGIEYNILGISKWIRFLGLSGTSSHTKFIPKKYEGSPHLLRGLFDTDAHVSKRDACIVYTTVSEQLANDVIRNLHYFGIVARKKHYTYPKSEKSPAIDAFQITITTNFILLFYEHIGFEIKRKQDRLEEIVKEIKDGKHGVHSNIDTIPKEWRSIIHWKRNEKRDLRKAGIRIDNQYGTLRKKVREAGSFLNRPEITKLADTDIFWDEIEVVEEVGEVEFSAIGSSIENYITPDGVIHHNSTLYGIAFILWLWACVSPELRIFYTSSNGLLLDEVSDKLSSFLNSKQESIFQFVFHVQRDEEGKFAPKNTGDVFNIIGRSGKGFSLILRTAGGSTVGIHPNVIIVDDPCFVGDTPVITQTGEKRIKDIKEGEFVLTRNGYKKVISSGMTSHCSIVKTYNINGYLLTMTHKHKIITENRGKVPICEISEQDIILKYESGVWKKEKAQVSCILEGVEPVYNLTVENDHEFVANGLLVANCDRNDRESEMVRKKKEHWFDSLTPLLVPFFPRDGGPIIKSLVFIATRWHRNDLMDYIFQMNKRTNDWNIEVESIYKEDGTSRYPEFITDADIEKIKNSINLVFFACQYQNDPLPEGLRVFNEDKLHFVSFTQVDMSHGQLACFFDPSQGKEASDWPATIWTHYGDNKLTIFDALNEKMELALLVHFIARQNKRYGVRYLKYETNGSSLVKENLISAHEAIGHSIQIDDKHHSRNKGERIVFMQPSLYSGFCRFMDDWEVRYPEMMDQLLFYPAHNNDDYPDVIEMAIDHYVGDTFEFVRYEGIS